MEYMLTESDLYRVAELINTKMSERCRECSKELLDKKDALIYGLISMICFAIMIKYIPMLDKAIFDKVVTLGLVGVSFYGFIWFKKKIEKRQEKYFFIMLIIVIVYLVAPKALESVIQKLIPDFIFN